MIICTLDCKPQPWKNGGGVTRELLTWPLESKGTNDWQLRISVADITKDGAFSRFEGVSRAFAVIDGAGVQLQLNGAWQDITQASEPVVFDGAQVPNCKLIDGATQDLNVMCQHGGKAMLTRAYAGQTMHCRGFFSKIHQSLTWMDADTTFPSDAGLDPKKHIGWWIECL